LGTLHYYSWVANVVPVRKKKGEIKLCVDFRSHSRASLKDNYPLPKMEQMDGLSGYNQVAIVEEGMYKTVITTL